jgi:MoaA/NifB/PqqE/SkfB family radical SAM enzyme
MSANKYEKVLDKILAESPLISMIQLFNWGEPMLNVDLAKIVEITNSRSVLCSLSSNMNRVQGLEAVITAKPAFFRVSMSGNDKTYSVSHTGGSWPKLLDNLNVLSRLRKTTNPEMVVEVAYHVYANTTQADIDNTKKLCESLGFVFRPHLAALLPLDNVLDYKNKKPVSPEANATIAMVRLPMDEALVRAGAQKDRACSFERTLSIESDCSVKQCGLWTRPEENEVAHDFLAMPLDKIMKKRREHPLCVLCKAHGLHRFCSIYTDDASNLA